MKERTLFWVEAARSGYTWIKLSNGVYSLSRGDRDTLMRALARESSPYVLLFPDYRALDPRIQIADVKKNWLGNEYHDTPDADWVHPVRRLDDGVEYLTLHNFPEELYELVTCLTSESIDFEIDASAPFFDRGAGVVVSLGQHESIFYLVNEGVPLVKKVIPWGLKKLNPIIFDFTRMEDHEKVLKTYGFLRTHHDKDLLRMLLEELEVFSKQLDLFIRMPKKPYQHPVFRVNPQWLLIDMDFHVPGLDEVLTARHDLPLAKDSGASTKNFLGNLWEPDVRRRYAHMLRSLNRIID